MADLVGQTLGNYRIEALLGVGGMGEVYRALHTRLDRPAAIKVLHANQAADASFEARFLREARAAAALSHPNIVEVFDFGEQDGASYLVMELVPDGSLRTLLRQRAKGQGWTLGLGIDLVRQAAEGLAYAHARGMVHRDIKPDNLLLQRLDAADPLTARGEDETSDQYLLKISDFGLARLVDESGELTATGVVMGTPTYMSPEQCQGGDLDGRSDLYSLGVVLYEVATGAPPFRVKSLSEAVFKHISAEPEPPRSIQPDLPLALEDVILRCLAKRPDDRFATGVELAEALDGALGDTELRTVITSRRPDLPATSTPAISGASSTGSRRKTNRPAVATATAGQRTPEPATSVRIPTTAQQELSAEPTVAASPADEPAPPVAARAGRAIPGARAAQAAWPPINDAEATVASGPMEQTGGAALLSVLQERPGLTAGVGAGVLGVVVLLIIIALMNAHGTPGKASASGVASHATATVVRTPTPTATPATTLKYQNSLSSYSSQWSNSSHSYFANGGYELNGGWISFAPVDSTSDGVFSVQMRQLGGPSSDFYGILFRSQGSNLYYFYGIAQDQQWTFSIIQNGNGTPIVAPTTSAHINSALNSNNTITVQAQGSHFTFFINGVQVGSADDSRLSSGRTGLINTSGDLKVVYNDFSVRVPAQ